MDLERTDAAPEQEAPPGMPGSEETQAEEIVPEETEKEDLRAALDAQYAALRAFDPQAPAPDALWEGEKGETLLANAAMTGDLVSAYKLTFFDELQARGAARAVRAERIRGEEKAHLLRTQAHGTDEPLVTREMLEAYRVFDPEITADEVRRYEKRDRAGRNNYR